MSQEVNVKISKRLLDKLAGRPVERAVRADEPTGSSKVAPPVERRVAARQPARSEEQDVMAALQRSRRVGGMLLKSEAEEMIKVRNLVNDLHSREFRCTPPARAALPAGPLHARQRAPYLTRGWWRRRPPRTKPACGSEKDACLSCYSVNSGDPLRCAKEVKAFTSCTRAAQEAYMTAGA
mmetsp:Transcript_22277/g.69324  ORF Transcript_22277/g.69324 Transcript_22277/m.69324 type:complete len:180 (-) Transcript_22277:159-698(-)